MTDPAPDPLEQTPPRRNLLRWCGGAARACARHVARHTLEGVALLFAVAVTAGAGVVWWLNQGPVSLEPFKDDIRSALMQSFNAEDLTLGSATASWSSDLRSIVITLTDVEVRDAEGDILGTAPFMEAAVRLGALLRQQIVVSRVAAQGGSFSIVRRADGSLLAAFGPPDELLAMPPANTGAEEEGEARTPRFGATQALRRLSEVQLRDAEFYVVDERLGAQISARSANVRLTQRQGGFALRAVGGLPDIHPDATFDARARVSDDFRSGFLVAAAENIPPVQVVDPKGALGVLARLDAPVSFHLSTSFENGALSLDGDLDAQVGPGALTFLDGEEREVRSADFRMLFNDEGAVLENLSFDVEGLRASFTGSAAGVEEALRQEPGAVMDFDLAASGMVFDLRPVFMDVLNIERAQFRGQADISTLSARFDALELALFDVEAAFTGDLRLEEASNGYLLPAVRIQGPLTGEVRPEHVMATWPVEFIDTARDWVRDAIVAGRAFDGYLEMDLPVEAWIEERIDDDRLTFSFAFEDAEIIYIDTMSPLVDAVGSVELRGNSLDVILESGRVERIDVSNGYVNLPELKEPGGQARFGADGQGPITDMLALLDSDPVYLLQDIGRTPDQFAGYGGGRLELSWPILDEVPPELVTFEIDTRFEDVFAPGDIEELPLSGARVIVKGHTEEIIVEAEGKLGPADATIYWVETPLVENAPTSNFEIKAKIDNADWDRLGLPTREVLSGEVSVTAKVAATKSVWNSVELTADLTSATLRSPVSSWRKPAGAPADAQLRYDYREDGGYDFSGVRVSAEGLLLQGEANFGPQFRIEAIDVESVLLEDYVEARGRVRRMADDGLLIDIAGSNFNAEDLIFHIMNSEPVEPPAKFELLADFDRVSISPRDDLLDVTLSMTHNTQRIEALAFRAAERVNPGAPSQPGARGEDYLTADLFPVTTDADANRKLCVYSTDVSPLMRSFLLNDDFRGGVLTVDGDVPPASAPAEASTNLQVRVADFRLVNTPILAQLLTSVVSLRGLTDTLNGEGISFNRLEADVNTAENVFFFERALMSGPALGVSTSGMIDADGEELSVQGTLAPAYGVSSVIGAIPLVGDVLTSREGEGVLGVTFSIRGPFTGASIRVNPLSALAPGVLRRIFEGRLRDEDRFHGDAAPERIEEYACFSDGAQAASRQTRDDRG